MLSGPPFLDGAFDGDCLDCRGEPPPFFNLPPPPCPPDIDLGALQCPFSSGVTTVSEGPVSIAVVGVSIATFLIIAAVAGVIICRRRFHRTSSSKCAPPIQSFEDDLQITALPQRAHSTLLEPGRGSRTILWGPLGTTFASHRPLNEDTRRMNTEPLYHTISSASGGSTNIPSSPEGSGIPPEEDSEEGSDSLTPFLMVDPDVATIISDTTPSSSVRYYMSVPIRTLSSSPEYETLSLRKPLPPLPSRSERFKMFLPTQPTQKRWVPNQCSSELYENVRLASQL